MQLNSDLNQRVVIYTDELPWVDSPMTGVQRRMLERDGDEYRTLRSGSSFSAHTHGGGEEFLVLDGVFSDEKGDYPAGTYVRNPVGSTHTPRSEKGCTILVKLWQFSPDDQKQFSLNTNSHQWQQGLVEGLKVMPLHTHESENVALVNSGMI